jgi:hypothetical protein
MTVTITAIQGLYQRLGFSPRGTNVYRYSFTPADPRPLRPA